MKLYLHWLRLLGIGALIFLTGLSIVTADQDVSVPNWSFESDGNEDGIPDDWENVDSTNILTNPGFEEGLTDWSTDGNNRNGILDTSVFRTGTASARITGGVPWTSFRHRDIPIEPGETYLISAYVKTQNVTSANSKVYIQFGTRDQAGNWVKPDNSAATNLSSLIANKGTQDWHKIEATYTAAANEAYITYLRIRINSVSGADSEIAWFDDLVIRKAGGIDKNQAHTGNQSLQVTGASSDSLRTWWSSDIAINGGRVYDIAAAVKVGLSNSVHPFYSVQFRQGDGSVTTQTVTSVVYEEEQDANGWSTMTGTLIAPKDAQSARIGLNVQGSGHVWFDTLGMTENVTPVATRIRIDGLQMITISEATQSFLYEASVWDQYDQIMPGETVQWSVDDAPTGVSIDPDSGILTITGQALSTTIQVHARSMGVTDAVDRMTVVLAPRLSLYAVQHDGSWEVTVEGAYFGNLYAYELQLAFDPASMQLLAAESLIPGYATEIVTVSDDVYFAGTLVGKAVPLQGTVPIAKLTLEALASSPLILKSVTVVDSQLNSMRYLLDERLDITAVETLKQAQPGKPVLSDNHGHITGLRDGNYTVSMNMWWGNNGSEYRLYENDRLIDEQLLAIHDPSAQLATTEVQHRADGVYVYRAELRNKYGNTYSDPLTVTVVQATPGEPVLSHNNWDGDGHFQVTMNMWWGTNGQIYRLYENDELIEELMLAAASPTAQTVEVTMADRLPGTYVYRSELINEAGVTSSKPLTVEVRGN